MVSSNGGGSGEGSQETVKDYQIHISSKYLELTRQKLELTRLPREEADANPQASWQPKTQVESLIDFWLERYSWKEEQARLNEQYRQQRVTVQIPGLLPATRVHVVHATSLYRNALPLLLIPPFPLTNLSISHLVKSLTDPADSDAEQPFHVVIPALPGLGFSDALSSSAPVIATSARILDLTMRQLGYRHYIASLTGAASMSPAQIDWKIARCLSHGFSDSCLAINMIAPPLIAPSATRSTLEWLRWKTSSWLRTPMLGYSGSDLAAMRKAPGHAVRSPASSATEDALQNVKEPSVLSYALCDSPTGLLLFLLLLLKHWNEAHTLSHNEILTKTELMWLPGPEGMIRFWAASMRENDMVPAQRRKKPMIGLTVFSGGEPITTRGRDEEEPQEPSQPARPSYACPAWATSEFRVLSVNRACGTPGILSLERPEVIEEGIRELAKAVKVTDKRYRATEASVGVSVPQETVALGDMRSNPMAADVSGTTIHEEQTVANEASQSQSERMSPPLSEGKRESLTTFGVDSSGHLRPVTSP